MQLGEGENIPFNGKTLLFALGGGILSAILAFSLITGSGLALILAYLAPFPLFLVGLGHGGKATLVAVFSGIAIASLIGGPYTGALYAIMTAFPSWLAIRLYLTSRTQEGVKQWFPIGHLLLTLSGYACALFILGLAFFSVGENSVAQLVKDFLSTVLNNVAGTLPLEHRNAFVEQMFYFFPAMVLVSWLLMTTINGALAQSVLAKSGKALRPTPKYGEMSLPDLASWVFIVCAAATVLGSGDFQYIARNLTVVMALPFLILGLTVVHKLVRLTRFKGALLTVFYMLLLLSVWVALPVIGLGLFEQWIGLRKKIPCANTINGE